MEISTAKIKKDLFDNANEGKWEEVVEIYEKDRRAHKAKITKSGQTALHLAIYSGAREGVVERLVELIMRAGDDDHAKQVMRMKSDKGHTPLHLAAAAGSVELCECVVRVDKSLVRVRDKDGETPIFRAVHYARNKTFFFLHSVLIEDALDVQECYSCCKRDDGRTILHDAIISENFNLALMIIHLYKDFVNDADNEGEYPLHALARKPAAFESGIYYRGLVKIIYRSIHVKELNKEELESLYFKKRQKEKKENPNPPKGCLTLLRDAIRVVTGREHQNNERLNAVDIERHGKHISPQAQENQVSSDNCSALTSYFKCFIKPVGKAMLKVLGYGNVKITKMRREKEKHVRALQVLDELLNHTTMYSSAKSHLLSKGTSQTDEDQNETTSEANRDDISGDNREDFGEDSGDEEFGDDNQSTSSKTDQQYPINSGKEESSKNKKEAAILIAAKYGIVEIVEKILKRFPVAIYDTNTDKKNVLLVAVENRNLGVYKLMKNIIPQKHMVLRKVDKDGNTVLHYAAMYKDNQTKPWPVPGAALQMQWEIKWFEFVENNVPHILLLRMNASGQTPSDLFSRDHAKLVEAGGNWLINTATSCSVVATLIATVAFATSNPGGMDTERAGFLGFEVFAIASLIALCSSVTSLITFLAILTSRHQEEDFGKDLPRKILLGLTSLFISIASILVTFCVGHFLVFKDKIHKYASLPVYVVTFLPLCLFAVAQFSLYFDIFRATFKSPF